MPPVDDQLTTVPPPVASIVLMPCFVPSHTPRRSTPITRSYSSSVISARGEAVAMPATFRTASTRPKALTAAANIASTEDSSDTSTWHGTTASPSAAAVSSSRPLMSAASTWAPSRTNTSVDARAIPEPAPVMTATFPSSSVMAMLYPRFNVRSRSVQEGVMAEGRRPRAASEEKRRRILDATEEIMLKEGYAAVSSRSVATAVGIQAPLVHYYFSTLDDLFVAVLERRAGRNVERMAAALLSTEPLRAWWQLASDRRGTALMVELLAAANHRSALKAEMGAIAREMRRMQLEVLESVLDEYGIDPE